MLMLQNIYAEMSFARLHYKGGGDWYNDAEVLPNLAKYINDELGTHIKTEQEIVNVSDANISNYPFIYMTGHGKIKLTNKEKENLHDYLLSGGFLFVDDDYGLDKSFRLMISELFPDKKLVELPKSHPIFNSYYNFPKGLPKTHKHDDKRPQAYAIFDEYGRMMVLYLFESNVSDGWAFAQTHKDPENVRQTALKFGLNIIYYLMSN